MLVGILVSFLFIEMRLKTLDLTNYIQIGDAAMRYIGQIHSLRKLRLSNTKVSDAGLLFLEGKFLRCELNLFIEYLCPLIHLKIKKIQAAFSLIFYKEVHVMCS